MPNPIDEIHDRPSADADALTLLCKEYEKEIQRLRAEIESAKSLLARNFDVILTHVPWWTADMWELERMTRACLDEKKAEEK